MRIAVSAKPRSKEERIEKSGESRYSVWVKEPPIKGMANEAIRRALAGYFNCSPSSVRLVSGFSSKQKVFEIIL